VHQLLDKVFDSLFITFVKVFVLHTVLTVEDI
jgi:hypothetical protein